MAEGNMDEQTAGGWWDSWVQTAKDNTWLQAAKDKSSAALEQMKKDLSEFTCTVQTDTSNVVATTSGTIKETIKPENAEAAKSRVKSGISSFLDGITRAFTIPPDDGQEEKITIQPGGEPFYDRGKARLAAIQLDPGTYCKQPSGSPEHYKQWQANFDLDAKKGEISEMLVCRVEVRALYTKLVPSEVSHADFWARYFYKVHQLQLDEARKVALMRRAEQTHDDSFTWDDEEEDFEDMGDKPVRRNESPTKSDLASRLSPEKTNVESDQSDTKNEQSPVRIQRVADSQPIKQDHSAGKGVSLSPGKVNTSDTVVKNVDVIRLEETRHTELNSDHELSAAEMDSRSNTSVQNSNIQSTPAVVNSLLTSSDNLSPAKAIVTNVTQPHFEGTGENANNPSRGGIEECVPQEMTTDTVPVRENDNSVEQALPSEKPVISSVDSDTKSQAVISEETVNADEKADDKVLKELKTREKGDMVVVGSGSASPVSESSNNTKDPSSADGTDEDWVEDFNIELTEEDIRAAEEAAKKYKTPLELADLDMEEDDWNWD